MSYKILLIDDEPTISNAIKRNLELASYDVEVVDNAKDAFEKMQNNKYNAVLLDVLMPIVDGIAVLDEISHDKSKYNNQKIIVMTNNSSDEVKQKAESYGIVKFFDKGMMSISDLVDCLETIK